LTNRRTHAISLVDRVELEVPGELLVAPARQHVLKRLFLGMQQLNTPESMIH
jgi:hypothetical protein